MVEEINKQEENTWQYLIETTYKDRTLCHVSSQTSWNLLEEQKENKEHDAQILLGILFILCLEQEIIVIIINYPLIKYTVFETRNY